MAELHARFTVEIDVERILNIIKRYGKATITITQEEKNIITVKVEEIDQIIGKTKSIFFLKNI